MSLDDPQQARFANIAAEIHQSYRGNDDGEWVNSPFAWIRSMPSRTVGAIGEKLVSAWCLELGLDVVRAPDGEADRLISGNRVEIKFSTRWQNGEYRFQQIRNQNYEFLFALGTLAVRSARMADTEGRAAGIRHRKNGSAHWRRSF